MRIIIHIGCEKTGTTAIQKFLYRHEDELQKNNISILKKAGIPNNRKLVAVFEGEKMRPRYMAQLKIKTDQQRIEFQKRKISQIGNEIQSKMKTTRVLIISSEHFHSVLTDKDDICEFYNFIRSFSDDVAVVCYVREQSDMLESYYSTGLKTGLKSSPEKFFAQERGYYLDFWELSQKWTEIFGNENVKFRLFHPNNLINKNIIDDFFENFVPEFPMTQQAVEKKYRENTRLGFFSVKILQWVNKNFPVLTNHGDYNHSAEIIRKLTIKCFGSFGGDPKLMSASVRAKIREKYTHNNKKLADKFLSGQFLGDFI